MSWPWWWCKLQWNFCFAFLSAPRQSSHPVSSSSSSPPPPSSALAFAGPPLFGLLPSHWSAQSWTAPFKGGRGGDRAKAQRSERTTPHHLAHANHHCCCTALAAQESRRLLVVGTASSLRRLCLLAVSSPHCSYPGNGDRRPERRRKCSLQASQIWVLLVEE